MRVRAGFSFLIVFALSASSFGAEIKPKYGPAKYPYATPLASSHDYFQSGKHSSPDFWALIGYYVPQYSGSACSAASLTMVLNAARAPLPKTADDKLILQQELVEKTPGHHWKERLSTAGYGLKMVHGVNLDLLREIAETVFRAHGFPKAEVEAVHVRDLSSKTLALAHQALTENEKSSGDFMIGNFNQQLYTDDSDAGHIAPVAAYDAEKKRVLILDPDRDWYEPYWISEQRFVEGMNTKDSETSDFRGYILVKLNR